MVMLLDQTLRLRIKSHVPRGLWRQELSLFTRISLHIPDITDRQTAGPDGLPQARASILIFIFTMRVACGLTIDCSGLR